MKNNPKLYNLKKINVKKGNVIKFVSINSKNYKGFGEVYFSKIKKNNIKAWKKHKKNYSNLTVILGKVKFLFINNRNKIKKTIITSKKNRSILIPPGIFYGFMGLDKQNVICSLINKPHTDNEVVKKKINYFKYKWR